MTIVANFTRGDRHYYVSKSTLALVFIGVEMQSVNCYLKRPKFQPKEYHRVRIEIVRTKAEAAAMNRKLARARVRNSMTSFIEKLKAATMAKKKGRK